jgi:hypothetical protein
MSLRRRAARLSAALGFADLLDVSRSDPVARRAAIHYDPLLMETVMFLKKILCDSGWLALLAPVSVGLEARAQTNSNTPSPRLGERVGVTGKRSALR